LDPVGSCEQALGLVVVLALFRMASDPRPRGAVQKRLDPYSDVTITGRATPEFWLPHVRCRTDLLRLTLRCLSAIDRLRRGHRHQPPRVSHSSCARLSRKRASSWSMHRGLVTGCGSPRLSTRFHLGTRRAVAPSLSCGELHCPGYQCYPHRGDLLAPIADPAPPSMATWDQPSPRSPIPRARSRAITPRRSPSRCN
jgi:hypothetical protein